MGFLTSVFGGGEDGMSWLGVGFALIIVLVLIIGGLWVLKLLFNASGSVTRGRQRRLAIIDTLNVDAKRSLLLVRRDDVEHLLIIGGAQDVVVETGISTSPEDPVRTAQPKKPPQKQAQDLGNATPAPERNRTAAASRLGLTGLLRRYNDPQPAQEPEVEVPEVSPLDRLKNLGQPSTDRASSSLRHTGLLRSASNDDSDDEPDTYGHSSVEEPQIPVPTDADSVMNGADPSDAKPKASEQKEAAADNAESDDGEEFAAQAAEITVEADEFAPAVSIDSDSGKNKSSGRESDLDEDATVPPAPRTRH